MSDLLLPQGRIPIGFATVKGERVSVDVDPQWMRFFSVLSERAGGISAPSNLYQTFVSLMGSQMMPNDSDEGDPGPMGPPGQQGIQGPPGQTIPGRDGEDAQDAPYGWRQTRGAMSIDTLTVMDQAVMPKASGAGIKIDYDAPAFGWRDIIGDITIRAAGASDPTFSVFRSGIRAFEFSAATMKEVYIVFHVPHDYVPGTAVYFHAHWANAAAVPNTGNVIWGFEYSYAKGYNQEAYPASTTVTVTQACPATQYQHNIAETAATTITGMEVDGLILCRVYRDAAAVGDTCTDTAFLFTADIHYQSSNLATKGRNATGSGFYG